MILLKYVTHQLFEYFFKSLGTKILSTFTICVLYILMNGVRFELQLRLSLSRLVKFAAYDTKVKSEIQFKSRQ